MTRMSAETGASLPEVLDRETALARVEGDGELLGEMASLFLAECDSALTRIRSAVERLDSRSAALEAHALKGSLASLAASEACRSAAELEIMAMCGECSGASRAYDRLETALHRLRPVLHDLAHPAAS